MKFNADGKFKIVQFTDIHWNQACQLPKSCENREKVLQLMDNVLEEEDPDLVVLTGDVVVSRATNAGWVSVLKPIIDRKIKWAVVLGNHDHEGEMTSAEIISFLTEQPYSLVESGPSDIDGEGNYILKIKDQDDRDAAVIYCLDSLSLAPPPLEENGVWAWIEPSQIEWYKENSQKITKENQGQPLPSLAFFHIPLPEFEAAWRNKAPELPGTKEEKVCSPKINTGMFSAMVEGKDIMGVFVGHDHDNDYAGCLQGICLAYGRKSGLEFYGKLPIGARVIELIAGKREFNTWLRTGDGKTHDKVHFPSSF